MACNTAKVGLHYNSAGLKPGISSELAAFLGGDDVSADVPQLCACLSCLLRGGSLCGLRVSASKYEQNAEEDRWPAYSVCLMLVNRLRFSQRL